MAHMILAIVLMVIFIITMLLPFLISENKDLNKKKKLKK